MRLKRSRLIRAKLQTWAPPMYIGVPKSVSPDAKATNSQAEPLTPLACPRCFAQFGAPAAWPPAVCPSCKRETLKPQTHSQHG